MPIYDRLKTKLGENIAAAWFAQYVALGHIADGTATVIVTRNFARTYISGHYAQAVFDAIAAEHPDVKDIH